MSDDIGRDIDPDGVYRGLLAQRDERIAELEGKVVDERRKRVEDDDRIGDLETIIVELQQALVTLISSPGEGLDQARRVLAMSQARDEPPARAARRMATRIAELEGEVAEWQTRDGARRAVIEAFELGARLREPGQSEAEAVVLHTWLQEAREVMEALIAAGAAPSRLVPAMERARTFIAESPPLPTGIKII